MEPIRIHQNPSESIRIHQIYQTANPKRHRAASIRHRNRPQATPSRIYMAPQLSPDDTEPHLYSTMADPK